MQRASTLPLFRVASANRNVLTALSRSIPGLQASIQLVVNNMAALTPAATVKSNTNSLLSTFAALSNSLTAIRGDLTRLNAAIDGVTDLAVVRDLMFEVKVGVKCHQTCALVRPWCRALTSLHIGLQGVQGIVGCMQGLSNQLLSFNQTLARLPDSVCPPNHVCLRLIGWQ
jgi:hypothetical protein